MIGARLHNWSLAKLPKTDGVFYLLLLQQADAEQVNRLYTSFERDDVKVVALDTIGVSNSRNAAISHAEAEILLFADDDTLLLADAYPYLIERFQTQPERAFLIGRICNEDMEPHKRYPPDGAPVKKSNCGKVGTPEIALRLDLFRQHDLAFDTTFGAGTEKPFGEEYIFLCDALSKGLTGKFVALNLATHSGASTGQRMVLGTAQLRSEVLRRALGPHSWFYRLGYALKHRRVFSGARDLIRFLKP